MRTLLCLLLLFASPMFAQLAPTDPLAQGTTTMPSQALTGEEGVANPSMVTKVAVIAGLSLLPYAIMLLTSFTKIVVVLSLLRQALGVQQTPPNQVLNGIALLVSIYVMFPTGLKMYQAAQGVMAQNPPQEVFSSQAAAFVVNVADKAKEPLRDFLQKNRHPKNTRRAFTISPIKFSQIPTEPSLSKTILSF